MDTKAILKNYYAAWLSSDREAARNHLCDDLKFHSPQDKFKTADAFLGECWQYADQFRDMKLLQEAYSADAAFIAYRFNEHLVGEFHRFRDGKIAEVYVTFNPTV